MLTPEQGCKIHDTLASKFICSLLTPNMNLQHALSFMIQYHKFRVPEGKNCQIERAFGKLDLGDIIPGVKLTTAEG